MGETGTLRRLLMPDSLTADVADGTTAHMSYPSFDERSAPWARRSAWKYSG